MALAHGNPHKPTMHKSAHMVLLVGALVAGQLGCGDDGVDPGPGPAYAPVGTDTGDGGSGGETGEDHTGKPGTPPPDQPEPDPGPEPISTCEVACRPVGAACDTAQDCEPGLVCRALTCAHAAPM